jgi:isopropylmalate/homocitrate/citramalate synthase
VRDNERVSSSIDDIIDLYKKDVDRTLIRENLKKTPEERLRKAQQMAKMAEELREAGQEAGRRVSDAVRGRLDRLIATRRAAASEDSELIAELETIREDLSLSS